MSEGATSRAALAHAPRVRESPAEAHEPTSEEVLRKLQALAEDADRLQKEADLLGAQIKARRQRLEALEVLRKRQEKEREKQPISAPQKLLDVLYYLGWKRYNQVFQYQYSFLMAAPVPSPIPHVLWKFQFQFAGNVQVPGDGEKVTVRFDHKTRSVRQYELEIKQNLFSSHGDLITVLSVKPKITLDRDVTKEKAERRHYLTRVQLGMEGTFRIRGAAADLKSRSAVVIDLEKLLDPAHRHETLSFMIDFTTPLSIDDFPGFSSLKMAAPKWKWFFQIKGFVELFAPPETWMSIFQGVGRLGQAAKDVLVSGARAALQGARAAAVAAEDAALSTGRATAQVARSAAINPAARAALGGLLATAAAYATATLGALAIGREVRRGRDESIARSYCAGYAEELDALMGLQIEQIVARIERFGSLDFTATLQQIGEHVHVPNELDPFATRRAPTTQDVNYALALDAARELGRAGALVGVGQLLTGHPPETWIAIQKGERVRLAGLRQRGYRSLKERYLTVLNEQVARANVEEIGLPLLNLSNAG